MLIDAGRSERGWSRVGQFMKCPQLFSYGQRLGVDLIPAHALTRGSMGHILQAQQHAIWGAQQGGCWVGDDWVEDASLIMPPEEAVHAWCDKEGAGHEHLDRMIETFRRYLARYPESPGRVLAVEYPITGVLGKRDGKWGLWAESDDIELTPLNSPGHPDHDKPIKLTRRLDLVIEDRARRVYIWDHKHQARVQASKNSDAYAIDGGFAAFRILGKQIWERFGGVGLNLIQTQEPWTVARPLVPATPHRDAHFAAMLWEAEHRIASLDLNCTSPWEWPKSQHETTCYGRYGPCAAIKMCFYGKAGAYSGQD